MSESESNSYLAAPGEGDVERLLREAESLTQEVARETGTPMRDADALLSGELSARPDPLAAVDSASASIMSLEDLLGEMGPADTADDTRGQATPVVDPYFLAKRGTPRTPLESQSTVGPTPPQSVEIKEQTRGPRVEHMPSEDDAAPSCSDSSSGASRVDPNISQAPAAKPPKKLRVPDARRMLQLGKGSVRGLLTAVLLIIRDFPIGVLSFLDIPFRRTPRTVKNAIGIIGAITLCMGAAAWALPGLMRPKPSSPDSGDTHAAAPAAQGSGHSGGH